MAAAVSATAVAEPFAGPDLGEERILDFVEDFPKDGLEGFLRRLSTDERDQLFQLVEGQIRAEVTAEMEAVRKRERAEEVAALQSLREQLAARTEDELHSVSRQAVELSIAMAEQILRREVTVDRGALLKSIETIIFRAERGTRFKLLAHPSDVEFLRGHEDVLAELNIVDVNPDRRLEPGGCIISADGQEWDYTLGGRFETLAEVVRNCMVDGDEPGETS